MLLSIIIVNWNMKNLLEQCLRSIFENTKDIEYEIFVVDNASSDGSAQMVREKFLQVKLIENNRNVGFARANNQVLSQSQSKYLLLLNNDTIILPNAIQGMLNFMDTHSGVGMVGPKLINADGSFQRSCWKRFPSLFSIIIKQFYLYKFPKLFPFVKLIEILPEEAKEPMKVAHLLGACILVRQETINDVGYLDERFFMYLEETDWAYRMNKKGWNIYYLPLYEVIHFGQRSTRKNVSIMNEEGIKSYCKFFKKNNHSSTFKVFILRLIIVTSTILKLFLNLVRNKSKNVQAA